MPRRTARHRIRGVDYCINEWGDENAAQLFLLHGWGDTGSTFQFLVDELSADWMVIAPDWRGFGESHHRAECYWFPDYVADLDALLAIYSPDRAVRLVGHSMGANVAGLYAAGEVGGGVHGRNRLGANSLVDVFVFGRRAGLHAAQAAQDVRLGRLTLAHVRRHEEELRAAGVVTDRVSPVLLPDYTRPETRTRRVG